MLLLILKQGPPCTYAVVKAAKLTGLFASMTLESKKTALRTKRSKQAKPSATAVTISSANRHFRDAASFAAYHHAPKAALTSTMPTPTAEGYVRVVQARRVTKRWARATKRARVKGTFCRDSFAAAVKALTRTDATQDRPNAATMIGPTAPAVMVPKRA